MISLAVHHSNRSVIVILAFVTALAVPPGISSVGDPQAFQPSYLRIRFENGLIEAEMRDAPLQRVLAELAARTGVVFEVAVYENDPVTIRLKKSTLREAIERLIGPNNAIFYYGSTGSDSDRISLVRVFSRNSRSQIPGLRYIGTGSITKTGEDTIESADEALKILAESKNLDTRQKAIEVLVAAKSSNPNATAALVKTLEDTAPELRAAAIEGLASLGVRSALPPVLAALKDENPGVRQSAISAVALLGDYENIKDLKPLARDKDRSIAAAAEVAIRKLSERRP